MYTPITTYARCRTPSSPNCVQNSFRQRRQARLTLVLHSFNTLFLIFYFISCIFLNLICSFRFICRRLQRSRRRSSSCGSTSQISRSRTGVLLFSTTITHFATLFRCWLWTEWPLNPHQTLNLKTKPQTPNITRCLGVPWATRTGTCVYNSTNSGCSCRSASITNESLELSSSVFKSMITKP